METYQTQYVIEAKKLNLVKRIALSYTSYDGAVILGATRITVTTRVLDYLYNQAKGLNVEGDKELKILNYHMAHLQK